MPTPSPQLQPCYAPAGWHCSILGDYLPCPSNFYCQGGVWPPVACPADRYSPAASAHIEDCAVSMGNNLSAIIVFLIMLVILCVSIAFCCDYLWYIRRSPETEYGWYNAAQFKGQCASARVAPAAVPVRVFPVQRGF